MQTAFEPVCSEVLPGANFATLETLVCNDVYADSVGCGAFVVGGTSAQAACVNPVPFCGREFAKVSGTAAVRFGASACVWPSFETASRADWPSPHVPLWPATLGLVDEEILLLWKRE